MGRAIHHAEKLFASTSFSELYKIESQLGEGGFGAVYKATQLSTGQDVAIKVLKLDEEVENNAIVHRFRREMRLCAQLNHPHIMRLIDTGHDDDSAMYTVFEYVPGRSLRELIKQQPSLPAEQSKELMLQVLDALVCAHGQGILHRDLKPDNIMVTQTHRGYHAKLVDFGLSTFFGEKSGQATRITATHSFVGTYAYAAPEHLHGQELTPAADLYAWALTFIECLEGRPAISGEKVAQVVFQQMSDSPVALPARLEQHALGGLLRQTLEKNPKQRLASATQVAELLAAIDVSTLNTSGERGMQASPIQVTAPTTPAAPVPPAPEPARQGETQLVVEASEVNSANWSNLQSAQADLARLKQQHALQTRRRDTLNALSLRQRSTSGTQLSAFLNDITSTATDILDVQRTSIWLMAPDGESIRCLDLFERPDKHSDGAVLSSADFPSYFQELKAARTIAADDVYSHPSTRELLAYCSDLGISSMLDAPIWVGGRMLGVLCHEHVGTGRIWTEDEAVLASSLADMTSLALAAHERTLLESVLGPKAL